MSAITRHTSPSSSRARPALSPARATAFALLTCAGLATGLQAQVTYPLGANGFVTGWMEAQTSIGGVDVGLFSFPAPVTSPTSYSFTSSAAVSEQQFTQLQEPNCTSSLIAQVKGIPVLGMPAPNATTVVTGTGTTSQIDIVIHGQGQNINNIFRGGTGGSVIELKSFHENVAPSQRRANEIFMPFDVTANGTNLTIDLEVERTDNLFGQPAVLDGFTSTVLHIERLVLPGFFDWGTIYSTSVVKVVTFGSKETASFTVPSLDAGKYRVRMLYIAGARLTTTSEGCGQGTTLTNSTTEHDVTATLTFS